MSVKQWQLRFPQPGGQLHSEHRKRQPTRPLVRQQNHSPDVWHSAGHPAPCAHVLQGKPAAVQIGPTPTHGLHGPPPQPTQPATAPIETPVRVRKRPVPSELTPRNLKNCRLDDFPASLRAAAAVRSI
jgi:hypothetical protein